MSLKRHEMFDNVTAQPEVGGLLAGLRPEPSADPSKHVQEVMFAGGSPTSVDSTKGILPRRLHQNLWVWSQR